MSANRGCQKGDTSHRFWSSTYPFRPLFTPRHPTASRSLLHTFIISISFIFVLFCYWLPLPFAQPVIVSQKQWLNSDPSCHSDIHAASTSRISFASPSPLHSHSFMSPPKSAIGDQNCSFKICSTQTASPALPHLFAAADKYLILMANDKAFNSTAPGPRQINSPTPSPGQIVSDPFPNCRSRFSFWANLKTSSSVSHSKNS